MNYQSEPVSPEHIPALTRIINHYILHTTVSFYNEALTEEEMKEKVFFSQEYYQAFVVKAANEVIGYCAISQWKKQQAYRATAEINIYLHHGYTGKGIGSLLLNHAEQFARANNGIATLIAGLCDENIPSRRLLEKNGYRLCAHFERAGYKFGRELGVIYLQKFLDR